MKLIVAKVLNLRPLFLLGPLPVSGMVARECLLSGTWPDLEGHVAMFTRGLTCRDGAQDLGIPPGALSPVSAARPTVQGESLATKETLPADPVQSPVDTLDTQVVAALVTRVPVLAIVDHIATNLGTTLEHEHGQ